MDDDTLVNLYRLSSNSELLNVHTGRLHSLLSLKKDMRITPSDMAMLKALTQSVIDYATLLIESEKENG